MKPELIVLSACQGLVRIESIYMNCDYCTRDSEEKLVRL